MRGGDEDVLRLRPRVERVHRGGVGQVELGVRRDDEVREAEFAEPPHDRRTDETAVAGDEDLRVLVHVVPTP